MSHACHRLWKCDKTPHVLPTFHKVHNPLRLPCETTSERPKVARACGAFNILTSKCASRHNGVHFFDISTSKSGPELVCFVHFDFEMCFAPQRRALLRHLNFQKWLENGVFCTFWLRNVLRATTACNFSSLIWPDGSAPAALASLLFDPPEPQIIGKNTVFRDFPTFSRICIFFLLTLSLLWSSLFYSSLLCDSSHLCFSSVHIVGSLTSKLPSIIHGQSIITGLGILSMKTMGIPFINHGCLRIVWRITLSISIGDDHHRCAGNPVLSQPVLVKNDRRFWPL